MTFFLMLSAMVAAQAPAASDPRSSEAVALFDDLCVRTLLGQPSARDPSQAVIMKVDEKDARETLHEFDPDKAWGVLGRQSSVEMFVGSKQGICSAEVLASERTSILTDFDQLVSRTAAGLRVSAKLEVQNESPVNGKPASYKAWRLKAPDGDIMLALTATSPGAAGIQHLMTASLVK